MPVKRCPECGAMNGPSRPDCHTCEHKFTAETPDDVVEKPKAEWGDKCWFLLNAYRIAAGGEDNDTFFDNYGGISVNSGRGTFWMEFCGLNLSPEEAYKRRCQCRAILYAEEESYGE